MNYWEWTRYYFNGLLFMYLHAWSGQSLCLLKSPWQHGGSVPSAHPAAHDPRVTVFKCVRLDSVELRFKFKCRLTLTIIFADLNGTIWWGEMDCDTVSVQTRVTSLACLHMYLFTPHYWWIKRLFQMQTHSCQHHRDTARGFTTHLLAITAQSGSVLLRRKEYDF